MTFETKKNNLLSILKWTSLCLFFGSIVFYASYEARWLISGPILRLQSPSDGEVFSNPLITVSGEASRISYIFLNDTKVYVDDSGRFSYPLMLMPGYNVITVKALNMYGEEISRKAEVVYKPTEHGATFSGNNLAGQTQ